MVKLCLYYAHSTEFEYFSKNTNIITHYEEGYK